MNSRIARVLSAATLVVGFALATVAFAPATTPTAGDQVFQFGAVKPAGGVAPTPTPTPEEQGCGSCHMVPTPTPKTKDMPKATPTP
jgi:hypothetical protein